MSDLPATVRIGHLRYRVQQDDDLMNRRNVVEHADMAGYSSASRQSIVLARFSKDGDRLGDDFVRQTLLHEVLHSCLRVASCDPDDDAKAGVVDVEERAVDAISGTLLAALRDNPQMVAFLLADT